MFTEYIGQSLKDAFIGLLKARNYDLTENPGVRVNVSEDHDLSSLETCLLFDLHRFSRAPSAPTVYFSPGERWGASRSTAQLKDSGEHVSDSELAKAGLEEYPMTRAMMNLVDYGLVKIHNLSKHPPNEYVVNSDNLELAEILGNLES